MKGFFPFIPVAAGAYTNKSQLQTNAYTLVIFRGEPKDNKFHMNIETEKNTQEQS